MRFSIVLLSIVLIIVLVAIGYYYYKNKFCLQSYTFNETIVLAALALQHTVQDQHKTLTDPWLIGTTTPKTAQELMQFMYPHINFKTQPWQTTFAAFKSTRQTNNLVKDWGNVLMVADFIKDYGATKDALMQALLKELTGE